MALGNDFNSDVNQSNEGLGLGFGVARIRRSTSGKRIAFMSDLEVDPTDMQMKKKHCSKRVVEKSDKSLLQALPQDILIRILCGVEHDDLKQLVQVSKPLKEATLIVKEWHFAYTTPRKVRAFREPGFNDEIEAPCAPKQSRVPRFRLSEKKLADVSVALFDSQGDDEQWSRKNLFMDIETCNIRG